MEAGNHLPMDMIEEVDGVHRLTGSDEDPVQALWRLENEARLALRFPLVPSVVEVAKKHL